MPIFKRFSGQYMEVKNFDLCSEVMVMDTKTMPDSENMDQNRGLKIEGGLVK